MKKLTTAILAFVLIGCSKSDDTIAPTESKENFDKGMSVIGKRQQDLREANKRLRENTNSQKASSAKSEK